MARIGLIVVGHPDYPYDVGLHMVQGVMATLGHAGVEFVCDGQVALQPWDAAAQARTLAAASVDGTIVFFATWIEAPTAIAAIREVEHLPIALWGFPMYGPGRAESTGSLVAYAVVKATLERMGLPFVGLVGAVDDAATLGQAQRFCVAATARARLRRARVGLIGYASMGMYSATFDHTLLRRAIGPEVDQVDTYTLVRQADSSAAEDCAPVLQSLRERARLADGIRGEQLEKVARLYLALRHLALERHWDAVNVKCQYELSQVYGMVACVPLSLLADEGLVTGCEGDVLTTVAQLLLHYLSGQPVWYGDLLDLHEGMALFSPCGMAPFSLADPEQGPEVRDIATPGFHGLISSLVLRRGVITYAQLAERADGYVLICGTGEAVDGPLRQGRFPAAAVRLAGSREHLLASLSVQHFAIAHGEHTGSLGVLVHLLGAASCTRV